MSVVVSIYRSPKKEGMYLYVEKAGGLDEVPESLLKQFGAAQLAMTLALTPERKLARAEAARVLEAIAEQGYYLQLPPSPLPERP